MRRGFSLVELAMVLVVAGLMTSFVLQATQSAGTKECYTTTKQQVQSIRTAIERFARTNDRLPLPAARGIGVENPKYGRETIPADLATIDQPTTVSWGALPFQALGLTPSMGGDCWGNKFTYVVTTSLTDTTGYTATGAKGTIDLKTSTGPATSSELAYAVISHGEDQLGAVKINHTAGKGWCVGATLKHTNRTATAAIAAGAPFNNGKDAGVNYFDDIVVASQKPQVVSSAESNAYCWGNNGDGGIGDGTTTRRESPVLVKGGITFASVSIGTSHTCGLDTTGKAYCWGDNIYGEVGDGSTYNNNKLEPTAVSGGLSFAGITAGDHVTCAWTAAGAAYCWGYNGSGSLGLGHSSTPVLAPEPVTGGLSFKSVSAGFGTQCGVTTTGVGYCWGDGGQGRIGDGTTNLRTAPRLVSDPLGGPVTWSSIITVTERTCGFTTTGAAYCWGKNDWSQLGDGTTTNRSIPTAVIGGHSFRQLAVNGYATCALTTSDDVYCWGFMYPLNNWWSTTGTPTILPSGQKFEELYAGGGHICGFTATNQTYCWGYNTSGQLGDGTTTNSFTPTLVPGSGSAPLFFTAMSRDSDTNAGHTCAIQPLTASWGYNWYGQIGDGTGTDRPTPVYVKMPSGVKYFTQVRESTFLGWGGITRCAIADTGQVYCWGRNECGQVGDGTRVDKNVPTAVPLPTGVTSFKSVEPGVYYSCGIGNNDKVYCWGRADVCSGAAPGAANEIALPSVTALAIDGGYQSASVLGSDGLLYNLDVWQAPTLVPFTNDASSPALPATAKAIGKGRDGISHCILGSDDQIYCNGSTGASGSLGDGSTDPFTPAPAGAFVKVTNPGGVASFKSLSVGQLSSGWSFACAIGNNNQAYCWGGCNIGMCGNGGGGLQLVPTLVTLPTGVTGWKSITVSTQMVTAIGDDGNAYYWGDFWADWNGTPGYINVGVPTKIPLPPGASGFQSVNGRVGITR